MRRVVLLGVAVALALPATAGASATTGRLLVSLAPSAPDRAHASAARAVVARAGARAAGYAVPEIGMVTVRPRRGGSLPALAARLRRDPAVRAVSVERVAALRELPSDPALTTPQTPGGPTWQWWAERSGFPVAWDRTHGEAATVAVIDSGIDAHHPEFAGRVRGAAAWVGDPSAQNPGVDESGHGTHVASLACGNAGNWFGIAGAGHSCGLIVEKTDLSDSSVVRAIVDATDRGADIINMSFGVDDREVPPQALVDALDYAWNRDVVMVAAAADSATTEQGDPANVLQPTGTGPDLSQGRGLSVTAVGPDDRRASFAGLGSQISMAAYGAERRPGPAADGLLGAFPGTPTRMERGSL